MAEFKFSCPHCGQSILVDDAWSGHPLDCPTCKKNLTVPQFTPEAPPAATSTPIAPRPVAPQSSSAAPPPPQPPAESKLKFAAHTPAQRATPAPVAAQTRFTTTQNPTGAGGKPGQSKGRRKFNTIAAWVVILAVLGVAGFYGYKFASARWVKFGGKPPASADAPAAPAAEVPSAPLPVTPGWTLELANALIPELPATGKIAGTNFFVAGARIDFVGNANVLSLRSDTSVPPDRQLLIYLHVEPGESIASHTWAIAKDMKGTGTPLITKFWKPAPQSLPVQKNFATGYVMKLELGAIASNTIPGKIFIALPDVEQSLIVGQFTATINSTQVGNESKPQ